jgi:hypothetical protein
MGGAGEAALCSSVRGVAGTSPDGLYSCTCPEGFEDVEGVCVALNVCDYVRPCQNDAGCSPLAGPPIVPSMEEFGTADDGPAGTKTYRKSPLIGIHTTLTRLVRADESARIQG